MKLLTLMDDQASEHFGLYHEHGLSFYIETASSKILFDFGAGSHTLDNARTLNLPLASIDYAIGSHGHSAGGILSPVNSGAISISIKSRLSCGSISKNDTIFSGEIRCQRNPHDLPGEQL